MNPELTVLNQLLASHDWYYNYSDDYSVYARGRDHASSIRAELDRLKALGFETEAKDLYKKYAKS
jgi:hypothetical protein